jgi:hypothetical protein
MTHRRQLVIYQPFGLSGKQAAGDSANTQGPIKKEIPQIS